MVSQVEEIKERVDVVDLVGSYIKLDRAGANFKARCPFHNERSASFFVSPARQIWHCFGCQKGGDVFKFVMEMEGCEFKEALEILATRAGVELKKESPQIQDAKSKYFAILEEATKFFEKNLFENDDVFGYLKNRGLSTETIKEFRLGYSLDDWRMLFNYLSAKGFKVEDIEKAGLVIRVEKVNGQEERYYDRFRGRIIFPIFNQNGKVIAFGGRIFPTTLQNTNVGAKYVNSPETAFYQKSKVLYGLHKSKIEILRNESCVIVEGYMDFLSVFQSGTKNVVASSGTALTEWQLKILRRICEKIVAAFDMDEAGESAARRGIELALKEGFVVKVLKFEEGLKDPADVLKKDKNLWLQSLQGARHIVQFYIDSVLKKFGVGSPELSREIQKNVLPSVANLFSELEQAHWVREISAILNIKEEAVWSALQKTQSIDTQNTNKTQTGFIEKTKLQTRKELLENRIIAILDKNPEFLENNDYLSDQGFLKEKHASSRFVLEAELFLEGIADAKVEFIKCVRELQKENLKEKMNILSNKIGFAEKNKLADLPDLITEFKNLSDKINKI